MNYSDLPKSPGLRKLPLVVDRRQMLTNRGGRHLIQLGYLALRKPHGNAAEADRRVLGKDLGAVSRELTERHDGHVVGERVALLSGVDERDLHRCNARGSRRRQKGLKFTNDPRFRSNMGVHRVDCHRRSRHVQECRVDVVALLIPKPDEHRREVPQRG